MTTQDRVESARPRGRRPAGSGTREAIIEAARAEFGERGYRATTLRRVGVAAGVDPRLVLHYFGSKQQLFMRSVQLPIEPEVLLERLFEPGPESIGRRAAELVLSVLDGPDSQRVVVGLIRAAASEPEAAELIRELLTTRLLTPVAEQVGGTQPRLRAGLMASQVVGLAMARHVVGIEPIVAASHEQLVAALTPVFEHYLSAEWTIGDDPAQSASGSPS